MDVSAQQLAELHAALLTAFDRDELRRLLTVHLDVDLEEVTGDKGLAAQVFDLLQWLLRRNRLLEFAAAAHAANPSHPRLSAACAALTDASQPDASPPSLPAILGIDWIAVPGGELWLGSDPQTDVWALRVELPAHVVTVAPFSIARCPITNYQYGAFVAATGHPPPPHWDGGKAPEDKSQHPIVNISWHDAVAFCGWAHVALPTEPQWELAARGTNGRIWPWGSERPTPLRCNYGLKVGSTTPVDLFPAGASPFGVLDMAGNAWEWTRSLWTRYPYAADDGREDLTAAGLRTVRGGSYDSPARHVRCAHRVGINPGYGYDDVGLRVVLYNPAGAFVGSPAAHPTGK
jgi:serine/threonine-protein kinase